MIPSGCYIDEDFVSKKEFGGRYQYDVDREDYIANGEHSDKSWAERTWESMQDDDDAWGDIKTAIAPILARSRPPASGGTGLGMRKGERNRTGKESGTDNPFKKLKPDPNKPGNVLMKDANGKTISKKAPEGFQKYWDVKQTGKQNSSGNQNSSGTQNSSGGQNSPDNKNTTNGKPEGQDVVI